MCYTEGQEFWWKNLIKMLYCIYVTYALSNLEAFLKKQRTFFCISVIYNFCLQQGRHDCMSSTCNVKYSNPSPYLHNMLIMMLWSISYCTFSWQAKNKTRLVPFIMRTPRCPPAAQSFPLSSPESNCATYNWQTETDLKLEPTRNLSTCGVRYLSWHWIH